jgi:IMP dehydrogenase
LLERLLVTTNYPCFDDVLLLPSYSDILSRDEISIETVLGLQHPFVPAPMESVVGTELLRLNIESGGMSIPHRFQSIDDQVGAICALIFARKLNEAGVAVGSIGVVGDWQERAYELYTYTKVFLLDVAHGHTELVEQAIDHLKSEYPDCKVIAGNVATGKAGYDLAKWGADIIRVGIGGGAACSTREQTGFGAPTLYSVMEVRKYLSNIPIIADGGIRTPGDAVKAIFAGADLVMMGKCFAECEESAYPGRYFGSASTRERYTEGKSGIIPEDDIVSFCDRLSEFQDGLRSGMSYAGCRAFEDIRHQGPNFIQVSNSSLAETHTRL